MENCARGGCKTASANARSVGPATVRYGRIHCIRVSPLFPPRHHFSRQARRLDARLGVGDEHAIGQGRGLISSTWRKSAAMPKSGEIWPSPEIYIGVLQCEAREGTTALEPFKIRHVFNNRERVIHIVIAPSAVFFENL